MVATITILYPTGDDTTFDLQYYLSKHIAIVEDKWRSLGLESWKITKLAEPNDTSTPYCIQALLEFTSLDHFQNAVDKEGATVMGDIPNYSNKQPVIATGEVILSS